MSNELAQSAISVVKDQAIAVGASGGGLVVGTAVLLNYFNMVAGALTVLASLILLVVLIIKGYYNIKLDQAQLTELERCNLERGLDSTRREDP